MHFVGCPFWSLDFLRSRGEAKGTNEFGCSRIVGESQAACQKENGGTKHNWLVSTSLGLRVRAMFHLGHGKLTPHPPRPDCFNSKNQLTHFCPPPKQLGAPASARVFFWFSSSSPPSPPDLAPADPAPGAGPLASEVLTPKRFTSVEGTSQFKSVLCASAGLGRRGGDERRLETRG